MMSRSVCSKISLESFHGRQRNGHEKWSHFMTFTIKKTIEENFIRCTDSVKAI